MAISKSVNIPGSARRTLTVPVLKQQDEKEYVVKILDKMRLSKAVNAAEGKKQMDPATICTVETEDGRRHTLIVNKVLEGVITEEFPGETYVGHTFAFTRHEKAAGKRYHTYSVDVLN